MPPTVLLFDLDGTLLDAGGAGRRAMESAFAARFGRPDACSGFSFGGMTDRAIVRRALGALGAHDGRDAIDALIALYLERLAVETRSRPGARLLPGVEATLQRLHGVEHLACGLGTGNVEAGAWLKLATVGLEGRFAFGGFGCDAEERAELLRVGARRGAARLGSPVERCRVVVVGDTPRDILAAREAGFDCVAVATGPCSLDELRAHSPDLLCADLTEPRALTFLLEPGPR